MAKISKKAIREALAPVNFKHCPPGKVITVLGYRVYWQKLYNAPGCVGYVWNPNYVIEAAYSLPDRLDGPFNWNGNSLSACVDFIHRELTHPANT